jgi:pyrroline-5-carboxylate reductase
MLAAAMQLGFIGAGNMATALARGIGEPVLVSDVDRDRAERLAKLVGGEALDSNRAVAERADAIVLCHKPGQLGQVAEEIGDAPKAVVSILAATPITALELAYAGRPVYRFMPNIPAEVKKGVFCFTPGTRAAHGPQDDILELFGRAGTVIELPEYLIDVGTALMGCGPAFFALVAEGLIDAGVRQGLTPDVASLMATQTMAGTAAVMAESGNDPVALRRRVTSPGGATARGLEALERGGVRAAFADAVDAVVEMSR